MFILYTRLTRSRIRVELTSSAYLGLGIIKIIICHVYTSDGLPYTRGIRIPCLLGVRNYLNNYFAMYTRLTRLEYVRNSHPRLLEVRDYLNIYFVYTSDALPYTRGTYIPRLLGVRNY